MDGREEQSEDSNDGDGSDVDEDREDGGVGSDVYYIDEDGEESNDEPACSLADKLWGHLWHCW